MERSKQSLRLRQKTIVLTGGHAGATAYATIQALGKIGNFDIHFIGASSAVEGRKTPTLEESFLPELGVKFHSLAAGRIQRRFSKHTIPSILRIPLGFIQAFLLLNKIRPGIVLSFGGFAAFPVVVVAAFLGIPVILHEQTASYGRANKLSQTFATKIVLARSESLKYFDSKKVVVLGNPVTEEIQRTKQKINLGSPPVVFVTGGSRGSETINETVQKILPELTGKYKVIHQVGLSNLHKHSIGKNYEVLGIIPPSKWSWYVENADIIVSRAGANIVSEVIASKTPAILIPIPWSFMNEQTKNAEYAKSLGIARIIPQKELSPKRLLDEIDKLVRDYPEVIDKIKAVISPDLEASKKLANLLIGFLK